MVNLYQNKIPVYEMISGASIAVAAFLLIIPGFLTDLIGFLLLIPFTETFYFLCIKNKSKKNMKNDNKTIDGEIVDHKKMTYKIIGKYIKDLKFNIPNPKTFFCSQKIYLIIKLILILRALR